MLAIVSGQPLIPTGPKFAGATKGTSIASLLFRHVLNYQLPYKVRTLTNASLRTLRLTATRNLGAVVGRTIPVVGYIMLGTDVTAIMDKTVTTYNEIVEPEDRI